MTNFEIFDILFLPGDRIYLRPGSLVYIIIVLSTSVELLSPYNRSYCLQSFEDKR